MENLRLFYDNPNNNSNMNRNSKINDFMLKSTRFPLEQNRKIQVVLVPKAINLHCWFSRSLSLSESQKSEYILKNYQFFVNMNYEQICSSIL